MPSWPVPHLVFVVLVCPVPFVVMLQGEPQAADVALKRDHPVVRLHVGLQVAVLLEGLVTDVAYKLERRR